MSSFKCSALVLALALSGCSSSNDNVSSTKATSNSIRDFGTQVFYSKQAPCDKITINGSRLVIEYVQNLDRDNCGPLKTYPAEYELKFKTNTPSQTSGILIQRNSGGNVLYLGKKASFLLNTGKEDSVLTLRFSSGQSETQELQFTTIKQQ